MEKESAVNLIDRILADAREAAWKVLADAEASCNGIRESQNAEIAKKNERFDKDIARETEIILNGCRTRAELDGRKETLRAKRALLDGVFEKAYANMLDLPAEKREALYRSILLREAKDPRLHRDMLSVTAVVATKDLRYAKVYISALDKSGEKEILRGVAPAG